MHYADIQTNLTNGVSWKFHHPLERHLSTINKTLVHSVAKFYNTIDLWTFLYILTPEEDVKQIPANQVLKGVSWNKITEKFWFSLISVLRPFNTL